jgi:hypothetical protein
MRRLLSHLTLLALGVAVSAHAQQVVPTFHVVLRPSIVMRPNNVVQVAYRLQFFSKAGDSLSSLAVLSPIPVRKVTAVSVPSENMLVGTHKAELDAASWAWLAAMPLNGQTVTPLSYEAVGLPGIVTYRAMRHVPVREARPGELDDDPQPIGFETPDRDKVVGKTIGVVAFPADRSRAGMLAWLRGQVGQACTLGWIEPKVCQSLLAKLSGANGGPGAVPAELGAERGKRVSEEAYVLLAANLAIVTPAGAP